MRHLASLAFLSIFVGTSPAVEPNTYFHSDFTYAIEPPGLLESTDLNGSTGQVGVWSGDDFPEGLASSHFSGGVLGGDSSGFVENPHGGRLLVVDSPVDDAFHFMELSNTIPNDGARLSFTAGLHNVGTNGMGDVELFGLDLFGQESFRIRLGADDGNQRLGYVAKGQATFDLPTIGGADAVGDFSPIQMPPVAEDDLANVSLSLTNDGYMVNYENLSTGSAYQTDILPYNGPAIRLARVGLYYRGTEPEMGAGFAIGDVSVTTEESPLPPLDGTLFAHVNDDQRIVLNGSGQEILGVEFRSEKGLLRPIPAGSNVAPFQFVLSSSANKITLGSLGQTIPIDDELVTPIGYAGSEPHGDLTGTWGNAVGEEVHLPVINQLVKPFGGFVSPSGKIFLAGNGEQLLGYEFLSPDGLLVPIPDGPDNTAPFQFVLSNTPSKVTVGNLGFTVAIDGELETPVGYRGSHPEEELTASWGDNQGVQHFFTVTGLECGPLIGVQGDFTGDGFVGFADFLTLSDSYNGPGSYADGDIDCDGEVGFTDFLLLSQHLANASNATSVPEPEGAGLVWVGVIASGLIRKRRSRQPGGQYC